ncbi:hypothetical protein RN001_015119 [Aquatica leii]|uniref:Prostaglandin E synthase 2 n=1 Tax=Aquatica leii TaxID=1421715 RepID=A0AAN7SNE2_9COLE|nr:hypothetical protein RN001_015119 [Aquatica leii]
MTFWVKFLQKNLNLVKSKALPKRRFVTAQTSNARNVLKLTFIGAGVGVAVGTGYSIYQLNKPTTHIINTEVTIPVIGNVPDIPPSRTVAVPTDESGLKLTLYQYQTCPFCCKVRAFLDYYGISYNIVEVDPVLRQSIKWSSYKKVPILLAEVEGGYQPLNDSTMIISALCSYLQDADRELKDIVKYYPIIQFMDEGGTVKSEIMNRYFLMLDQKSSIDTKEITEERKWRKWADDVLVHTLSPNVYRTKDEALQAFRWFSEVGEWEKNFPLWERSLIIYVGAFAMWMIGKRLKARHNLKDNVRISLYDECDYFAKAIKAKGTPFMGGNRPNLADLAVFGVLNSIEGCIAFQDLLENSQIKNWYFDMKSSVETHRGSTL